MLSIIPLFILAMACTEHMLTIVMAMVRRIGCGTDGSVIEIGAIYATYMLTILNVKIMLVYAYNMLGLCLVYFRDVIKNGKDLTN
jgi:hypothetical protein